MKFEAVLSWLILDLRSADIIRDAIERNVEIIPASVWDFVGAFVCPQSFRYYQELLVPFGNDSARKDLSKYF